MNEKEQIIQYNKWLKSPEKHEHLHGTKKFMLFNEVIKKFGYKKYLEIGVRNGEHLKKIKINHKDGVDPVPSKYTNYVMTSDEFFLKLKPEDKYDIIFIDGLHYDYQVYNDILNSLKHLSENGIIFCHDINPKFEICQRKKKVVSTWNGDCWKAFTKLKSERDDLEMYTIDTNFGIGVIQRGFQKKIELPDNLTFDFLDKDRKYAIGLISVKEFREKLKLV